MRDFLSIFIGPYYGDIFCILWGCFFLALRERKYKILLREDESDCPLYHFQAELFPLGVSQPATYRHARLLYLYPSEWFGLFRLHQTADLCGARVCHPFFYRRDDRKDDPGQNLFDGLAKAIRAQLSP